MSNPNISLRKAAILITALDVDTADMLLAQMPPEHAEAVRAEVLHLGAIEPAEQQAVIDAFFRMGPLQPQADPAGLELDDSVAPPIGTGLAGSATRLGRTRYAGGQPFDFLEDAETEVIVSLLEREHPQVIALVMAHLAPERAGETLAQLAPATQAEVLRRMANLEVIDPQVVREVAAALESLWESSEPEAQQSVGMAAVSAILKSSDVAARRQILNNLAAHDRSLAHKFSPLEPLRQFTFTQLCQFDLDTLSRVVRAADPETATLALAGAPADLVETLLDRLWPDEARRISKGLAHLGPTRLADIEHAQDELARLAGQMHAQGHLPALVVSHLTAVA